MATEGRHLIKNEALPALERDDVLVHVDASGDVVAEVVVVHHPHVATLQELHRLLARRSHVHVHVHTT